MTLSTPRDPFTIGFVLHDIQYQILGKQISLKIFEIREEYTGTPPKSE